MGMVPTTAADRAPRRAGPDEASAGHDRSGSARIVSSRCVGLQLGTRLNGEVVQDASTDDLVLDVATLVSVLSEASTLEAGDVIATGTPSGVGLARKPPSRMRPGDVCEVELEGLGVLRNLLVEQGSAT